MLSTAAICLALNVFYESRGESIKGQYAVAQVTLNRSNNESGNTGNVCGTVFEQKQFSWTQQFRNPKKRYVKIAMLAKKTDEISWYRAIDIARTVMAKKARDVTKGATYFNEKGMGRRYKTNVAAKIIGNHIFY